MRGAGELTLQGRFCYAQSGDGGEGGGGFDEEIWGDSG